MQACELLLTASRCLTGGGGRQTLEDAAVAVDRGVILDIGPRDEMEPLFSPARRLDLGQSLILPGLVNAHTHASMTLFRGIADDLPLMEWLEKTIWPLEARLSAELVELGALLAAAEMTRTGTTCFTDMYLLEESVARAAERSGLRAVLAEGILEFPTCSYSNLEEAFDKNDTLIRTYAGHPLLRPAVACHSVYTNSSETLVRAFELAERHDLPFMIHLAETAGETGICLERFGKRPLARLDELGLLSSRTLLAHGVHLQEEEISRIAETGASIAHCPRSNSKLASGMAPVGLMKALGVNVTLGTDGAASNNSLNMFGEMFAAALTDKARTLDPTSTPAWDALDMATANAAKGLLLPGLGRLAKGGPADLIALDLTRPNLQPVHRPESLAVYSATGLEVRLNMAAGELLYLDGRYLKLDWDSLLLEAEKARRWVWNTAKST